MVLPNVQSDDNKVIVVDDVCKAFRVYKDKSHTLKARILSRSRNHFQLNKVLDHISFSVGKGEAVGLIGHNGSGKSTTLKLLNRIIYPASGKILIKGKVSSLIELGAGFHPDMTGRENIYINATIFGLKKEEIDKRLNKIIRFSELEDYIDNPVRTYSSGMYMRLAFSIAINVDADVLLIDEILAVGDANFQRKCFDRLRKIKYEGTTIVIVSHSMEQIKSICDRVIWLEGGHIREDGDPRTVCQDYLDVMSEKAAERRLAEQAEIKEEEERKKAAEYLPEDVYPNCSKNCQRLGNMKTRFSSVRLCDSEGKEKLLFKPDEDYLIEATVVSEEENPEINVIVKIFNRYGGHCTTLESRWTENGFVPFHRELDFGLLLKKVPLMPGDYYIELAIRNGEHELTDQLLHFIEFTVGPKYNNGRDNLGVINISYKWKMDKGAV